MLSDLKLLSSAMTVWSLSSSFFQMTVSPALMVSAAGENLLFLIVIVWVLAVRFVVGDFSAGLSFALSLPFASSAAPRALVQQIAQARTSISRRIIARRDVII